MTLGSLYKGLESTGGSESCTSNAAPSYYKYSNMSKNSNNNKDSNIITVIKILYIRNMREL